MKTFLLAMLLVAATTMEAENKLAGARSRYLLQHASNPVDWYPWSDEAFAKAKREEKPIFLSIGYSTCHWCQVMEEESFNDPAIAKLLNESFVSIKVDREERPDIDIVYLQAARMLTGDAGWPNNVVLTSDGMPFFATAYVGKESFRTLISKIGVLWRDNRDFVAASSAMVMQALRTDAPGEDSELGIETLEEGFRQLSSRFDDKHGGFLPAPKFPTPHNVMFLLRYWRRTGDGRALAMAKTTLDGMRNGALRDAREGIFHRYATNTDWSEPHYEAMLYDQALLAIAYLEAYQLTGSREFAVTARAIFAFVTREMRSPSGTYFAARDSVEAYYEAKERKGLRKPGRDEKILTDWNGLMIAALAFGGVVLDEPAWSNAARHAADAILANRRQFELQHESDLGAFLDDYAFLVWGLLNLYEATFELEYLEGAIALENEALGLFRDASGRFYVTRSNAEPLPVRPRETRDGAIPSGNSVQLMNLVRLARITGDQKYRETATDLVRTSSGEVSLSPSASTYFLCGIDFMLGPSFEVVLSGDEPERLRRAVFSTFAPNKVVIHRPSGEAPPISRIAPYTKAQRSGRRAIAYVCTNYKCRLPTTDPKTVRRLLAP